eukprot:jgi/Mesvir1/3777/Mv08224-RA.1
MCSDGNHADRDSEQQNEMLTPADLVRYRDKLRSSPEDTVDHERPHFEVLEHDPWYGESKLTYVIARGVDGVEGLFTMKTRYQRDDVGDELSWILTKGRPQSPRKNKFLTVADIREGLLAFEELDDAERYNVLLEADGHANLIVAEVESSELFSIAQKARHLVILFRQGASLPLPDHLAQSLKARNSSLDEDD